MKTARIKYHPSMDPLVEAMRNEREAFHEMQTYQPTAIEQGDGVTSIKHKHLEKDWEDTVRERHRIEAEILHQADKRESWES